MIGCCQECARSIRQWSQEVNLSPSIQNMKSEFNFARDPATLMFFWTSAVCSIPPVQSYGWSSMPHLQRNKVANTGWVGRQSAGIDEGKPCIEAGALVCSK